MKKTLLIVAALLMVGAVAASGGQAKEVVGCGKVPCAKIGDCLAKLDLTEEQSKKIAEIRKESGCGEKPAEGCCPKKLAAKKAACKKSIMAVLTDEQKAKLAAMCSKGCPKKAE